ncbi:MAG: sigma-70 family RNA polymerase sigma factor [Clostridia bacterium]|nr:sigma-70 family RNA polymerase sigma factor [Clostridia bacterium]
MKLHLSRPVLSDEKIVELFFARNEQAIDETDRKYKSYLVKVAYNILSDRDEAEQCLDDTYVRAWNTIPPKRPDSLRAYLATVIRNCALNCYRARSSEKRIPSSLTQSLDELDFLIPDQTEDSYDDGELSRTLSEFIRSLDQRRMYIFMSRYYLSRPIVEIADLLGVSRSTVNKEIAAIKTLLREKLESEGFEI